jgi:hypothetical protein
VSKAAAGYDRANEAAASLDVMFLLFSAYLVFMMQLGFAVVRLGRVRRRSGGKPKRLASSHRGPAQRLGCAAPHTCKARTAPLRLLP